MPNFGAAVGSANSSMDAFSLLNQSKLVTPLPGEPFEYIISPPNTLQTVVCTTTDVTVLTPKVSDTNRMYKLATSSITTSEFGSCYDSSGGAYEGCSITKSLGTKEDWPEKYSFVKTSLNSAGVAKYSNTNLGPMVIYSGNIAKATSLLTSSALGGSITYTLNITIAIKVNIYALRSGAIRTDYTAVINGPTQYTGEYTGASLSTPVITYYSPLTITVPNITIYLEN